MEITLNVMAKVNELEQLRHRRYNYTDIADAANLSRHTVRKWLTGEVKAIDLESLGKLLDFFAAEGMPVTVADLFTVTVTPDA
jgi:DNA-binding Xre family transcriptional regulator